MKQREKSQPETPPHTFPESAQSKPPHLTSAVEQQAETLHQNGDNGKALEAIGSVQTQPTIQKPRGFDLAMSRENLRLHQAKLGQAKTPEAKTQARENLEAAKLSVKATREALESGDAKTVLSITKTAASILFPIPFIGPLAGIVEAKLRAHYAMKGWGESGERLTTPQQLGVIIGAAFKETVETASLGLDAASGGTGSVARAASVVQKGKKFKAELDTFRTFLDARKAFSQENNQQGALKSVQTGLRLVGHRHGESRVGIAAKVLGAMAGFAAEHVPKKASPETQLA